MNRRALFSAYNVMKKMAKDGQFDPHRVDKALGLAQQKEDRPYHTTTEDCDCKDQECRRHLGVICKHRLAAALRDMARETHAL
jgi:hypothetical protein